MTAVSQGENGIVVKIVIGLQFGQLARYQGVENVFVVIVGLGGCWNKPVSIGVTRPSIILAPPIEPIATTGV